MKKIAFLGFALTIMMSLVLSLDVGAQNEISGTMMVVKGEVKITNSKTGKTDAAKVGSKVHSGDTIASGADSRAKIVMSDKNVINISPDSKITIAKYENDPKKDSRNVELKVDYGKVRASVEQKYDGEKNKFNIRTPTAVAGVRGTDFVTGFNPRTQQTRIITFTGVVAAGQPGPSGQILNAVFVRPGMATNIDQGKPPEPPRPMPSDEMQRVETELGGANAALPDAVDSPDGSPSEATASNDSKPASQEGERSPAAAPGQMLDAKDLDTAKIVKDIGPADGGAPKRAPTNFNPVTTIPGSIRNSDYTTEAGRLQKSKAIITIVPQ